MIGTVGIRKGLLERLFLQGIPRLWCPLLTHYTHKGEIDFVRMEAHLNHVSTWVNGYLIPGSTGDGWELSDTETSRIVDFALNQARKHDLKVLLGVLKPSVEAMWSDIRWMLQKVQILPACMIQARHLSQPMCVGLRYVHRLVSCSPRK